jgi:hypothetical protein
MYKNVVLKISFINTNIYSVSRNISCIAKVYNNIHNITTHIGYTYYDLSSMYRVN